MLEAFEHQKITSEFIINNPATLITSDPGTGKTRSVIDAFASRKGGRMLVLAPLSILGASWGDDIEKFAPHLTYVLAYAKNREKAFKSDADIIITNHDAVKWLVSNLSVLKGFDTLCIDEFTAFKNKASQRSKSALKISKRFTYKIAMSGTPNSNTILDIWHPTLLVDGGERLGNNFSKFRSQVCTCFNNGFGQQWQDKPNAEAIVGEHIKDINIRYTLEDCIDMPPQTFRTMSTTLPPKILQQYKILESESVLYTNTGTINAVNAGSKVKKLLQLCTGAVYDESGVAQGIHNERYELVMQLVEQRKHTLVAFNWKHERDHMVALAEKMKINYGVIDGSTPAPKRKDIVDRMQAGQLQVVFCHPQSAGHGLTMTKATTIIWASPTYNAEHYAQFNRRIYRAGQTFKTEVIKIAAKDTWENSVFEKLEGKLTKMEDLLSILKIEKSGEAA